jgi:hypothetical protein
MNTVPAIGTNIMLGKLIMTLRVKSFYLISFSKQHLQSLRGINPAGQILEYLVLQREEYEKDA